MVESNQPPENIKSPKAQVFEHLFTGNKWDALTPFNPINVPFLIADLMYTGTSWQEDCGDAIKSGKGFGYRIPISNPDKLTVAYLLMNTTPSNEIIKPAVVNDLLKDGEQLGNTGVRMISHMRDEAAKDMVQAIKSGQEIYDQDYVTVIGVLDQRHRPSGLIIYRKGERPRGGKGMKVPQPSLAFNPVGA